VTEDTTEFPEATCFITSYEVDEGQLEGYCPGNPEITEPSMCVFPTIKDSWKTLPNSSVTLTMPNGWAKVRYRCTVPADPEDELHLPAWAKTASNFVKVSWAQNVIFSPSDHVEAEAFFDDSELSLPRIDNETIFIQDSLNNGAAVELGRCDINTYLAWLSAGSEPSEQPCQFAYDASLSARTPYWENIAQITDDDGEPLNISDLAAVKLYQPELPPVGGPGNTLNRVLLVLGVCCLTYALTRRTRVIASGAKQSTRHLVFARSKATWQSSPTTVIAVSYPVIASGAKQSTSQPSLRVSKPRRGKNRTEQPPKTSVNPAP
jgi:hypothetical protein